jgi:hypothetical protein
MHKIIVNASLSAGQFLLHAGKLGLGDDELLPPEGPLLLLHALVDALKGHVHEAEGLGLLFVGALILELNLQLVTKVKHRTAIPAAPLAPSHTPPPIKILIALLKRVAPPPPPSTQSRSQTWS